MLVRALVVLAHKVAETLEENLHEVFQTREHLIYSMHFLPRWTSFISQHLVVETLLAGSAWWGQEVWEALETDLRIEVSGEIPLEQCFMTSFSVVETISGMTCLAQVGEGEEWAALSPPFHHPRRHHHLSEVEEVACRHPRKPKRTSVLMADELPERKPQVLRS